MINYLEHHTLWENSEDKSEHIISMSFILLTYMPIVNNTRKKRQFYCIHYVIISMLEKNPSKACFSSYLQSLLSFPYTGIPYPY